MTTVADDFALLASDLTQEQTLSAALALIDDFDLDLVSDELLGHGELLFSELLSDSSEPSSPSTSSPRDVASANKAEAGGRRKKRVSKREQLIELRSTVKQLESRLQELHESKHSPDELWKAVVATQLMERQRAETENMQLRLLLTEQAVASRGLEQVLFRKRPSPFPEEQQMESFSATKRARNGLFHLNDPAIESELLRTVEAMYVDVDKCLNSKKFRDASDASEHHGDGALDTTILEGADTRVYPFEYQATAAVMWQVFAELIDSNSRLLQQRNDEEGKLFTRYFEDDMDLATWHGQFRVKVVGRRFVEENRIIHIACMLLDPVELGGKRADGLYIRRRVIDVIEPASVSHSTKPATLKRTYVTMEPSVYDSSLSEQERLEGVSMLNEFSQMCGKTTCSQKHQDLENRLEDYLGKMTLHDGTEQLSERRNGPAIGYEV
ncbi:hypothetical protein Poli38472_011859 [Pythium oligandrum]|uniref:Uncharacterized protein n=1 Tax=Pythium oligandrum TaxID=41045 RepID=A0A8K1C8C2_PYTOL|nr:hypothetical protein Poli38472_011859 [Pythium oligandrum]|eukprot:TMW58271.1 hypothetical protein Poli38472_011859 [Pythium oligandrum]